MKAAFACARALALAFAHVALSWRVEAGIAAAVAEATKAMRDKSCMAVGVVCNQIDTTEDGGEASCEGWHLPLLIC